MDIVYLAGAAALWAAIWGLASGCERLRGERREAKP